jgi:hypothetical protein
MLPRPPGARRPGASAPASLISQGWRTLRRVASTAPWQTSHLAAAAQPCWKPRRHAVHGSGTSNPITPAAVASAAGRAMAMACWTLTTLSRHTITVIASRTRAAAAQQNASGAAVKRAIPGCRVERTLPGCRRILPPMDAHLLSGQSGPAGCNAGDPKSSPGSSSRALCYQPSGDFYYLKRRDPYIPDFSAWFASVAARLAVQLHAGGNDVTG